MNIGISTACFYPQLIEDSLKNALSLGFKSIEIFFNAECELDSGFVAGLKEMCDDAGAHVVSIHPYTSAFESMIVFTDYARRLNEGKRIYEKYARAAAQLGAKYIVMHGDKSRALSDSAYYERFHQMDLLVRQQGVRLAQENVNAFRSQSPDFIRGMRDYLGSEVCFTYDIKQCVRAGVDPDDMLSAMGSNIVHVHINDHDDNNSCMLPGSGRVDYLRLKERLEANGFDGDWMIEVYSRNYSDKNQLKTCAQLLRSRLNAK